MSSRKVREKLKAQAPISFVVEKLSHEGRGVSHYGTRPDHPEDKIGKKVFISLALVGETVQAKIHESYKKYEDSDAVEIITASPDRVEPICPHFGVCGGCSLQHFARDKQILFKESVLREHFEHFGGIQPKEWLAPLVSEKQDYRTKARLGVRYVLKKEKLLIGFRERKSGYLADLDSCKVLDAQIGERLGDLKTLMGKLEGHDYIPQLELAVGEDQVAIIIRHLQPLSEADQNILLDYFRPLNWQVYLQPEGYETVHRIDNPEGAMRLHYSLPDFGIRYAFSPLDFTQVNVDINRKMMNLAIRLLDLQQGERVLDLFCGLGNFSLPLAKTVGETGKVIAVEGSEDMVKRGYENAKLNGLTNVEFYAQDLTKDFSDKQWASQAFDALLIDPPRSGAEEVMNYLDKFNAKRIVYVSCNPATLARDAGILVAKGYTLECAGVMDMFTHTSHVESIALFNKVEG